MDAETERVLELIHADMSKFRREVEPPADTLAIRMLQAYARGRLGTKLPRGYVEFLAREDGLTFNGRSIYATSQRRYPTGGALLGFLQMNENFQLMGERSFVFYGEADIDYYVQDLRDGGWCVLDSGCLDVVETYPDFDALLKRILTGAYEPWMSQAP